MAMKRFAFAVVLAATVMLGACVPTYPPGSRVVIFVQGVYTGLDENGTQDVGVEDHAFDALKAAFRRAGYNDAQLLDFSYVGGVVDDDGLWHPNPYGCEITDRPSDENLRVLESMLRDYRAKHPQADFTLIGHSLGGYLSFLEGVRDSQRPVGERLGIDVILTLQAPLKGVSADKQIALDTAVHCSKTYASVAEIVADKTPGIAALRASQAEVMRAVGIRLATLGNNNDCLYNLPLCSGGALSKINDSPTQYIDTADLVGRYDISGNAFLSHFALFTYSKAVAETPAFVGPP